MFDNIFENSDQDESAMRYDKVEEFRAIIEPKVDDLLRAAEQIGIPIIIVGCVSYQEEDEGDHTHCKAGIVVATHGVPDGNQAWYPDLMKTLMTLLTNPPLVHVIDDMLPFLKRLAEKRDDVSEVKGEGFTSFEEARKWFRKMLGGDDAELP